MARLKNEIIAWCLPLCLGAGLGILLKYTKEGSVASHLPNSSSADKSRSVALSLSESVPLEKPDNPNGDLGARFEDYLYWEAQLDSNGFRAVVDRLGAETLSDQTLARLQFVFFRAGQKFFEEGVEFFKPPPAWAMNTSLTRLLRNHFFEGAADALEHAPTDLIVQKTNHPGLTPQDQMDFLSEVVARNPVATGDVIGRVWPKEKDEHIKAVLELAAKKNPTEIAQLVKSPVLGKAAVLALEKLVNSSSSYGEQRDTDEIGTLLSEQLGVEASVLLKGSASPLLYAAWLSGKLTSSESKSAAAVQEVKAQLASRAPQPDFCAPILKQLASLGTNESIKLYDKIFGVREGAAWEAFLGAGLNESPELALDLLGQGEKQYSQFIRNLAGQLAKGNPENLLTPVTLAKIPVEQHPDFMEAAMVSLAIHHPQEALRRSLAGELSDLPKVAYEQIYRSVGRGSFHQVWEAAEKTVMPIEASSAIEFAMQGWADASPESAARWLTEQPVSAHRNAAIMGLVKVIARSDPKSADAWKAQLTP